MLAWTYHWTICLKCYWILSNENNGFVRTNTEWFQPDFTNFVSRSGWNPSYSTFFPYLFEDFCFIHGVFGKQPTLDSCNLAAILCLNFKHRMALFKNYLSLVARLQSFQAKWFIVSIYILCDENWLNWVQTWIIYLSGQNFHTFFQHHVFCLQSHIFDPSLLCFNFMKFTF